SGNRRAVCCALRCRQRTGGPACLLERNTKRWRDSGFGVVSSQANVCHPPGVSAPPPFGGNQRTVVIHVDPDRLRSYNMSPEEVVRAIGAGNAILPAGNVRTGDLNRIAPVNSVVPQIQELADLPIRTGAGATVFIRDVGRVENSTDILTG